MDEEPTSNALPEGIQPQDRALRTQREANESLVLAALRAAEEADGAQSARLLAETALNAVKLAADKLEETAAVRERLIGIIGHDLRTPLNAMTMAGSIMLARGDLGDPDRRLALRIVESGKRVARMLEQLTDFTRARLGETTIMQRTLTDLGELCGSIADEQRVGCDVEIRDNATGDVRGYWDADRLSAVLANLVGNAVRYARDGTPVTLETYGDDRTVTTEVTNQGVTIPPELLPDLFEPFRRGQHNERRRAGHLGLGLYIACEIARAHGGSIEVHSALGITRFILRLPRTPPAPPG